MRFESGHTPWNTGLSKETDDRVAQPWLGKKRSEETKQKISQTKKGKRASPATEFKKGEEQS